MTEPVNPPVEPVEAPPQQVETPPAPKPQGTPEGFVEKARYDGLVRKVEELTLTNRSINDQLAQTSSEKEQLTGQLAIKEVDKSVAVGEYQKQLEATLLTNTEYLTELKELRATKAKLELVRKHNAGHIIPIIDRIPYLEDPEAMETVFKDFIKWGDDLAKEREQQILAGYTPAAGPPAENKPSTPETAEAWLQHIQNQVGADTEKAWDQYWKWGKEQQK